MGTKGNPPTGEPAVGCCSRDLGTCTHLDNSFCNANEENCEGPCGKVWLPSGDISDTCLPLWGKGCVTDSDCCLWSSCSAEGACDHDGTWKPPIDFTNSPTSRVTPAPTNPKPTPPIPSSPPSPPPTKDNPPTSEPAVGCCSRDLGTCTHLDNSFCNANKENCEGPCGKVWLPNGDISDTCLPLWEKGCVTDSDCCLWSHCSSEGTCDHDGTWKPPVDFTNSPTSRVTPAPTNPTTPIPSRMPSPRHPTSKPTL